MSRKARTVAGAEISKRAMDDETGPGYPAPVTGAPAAGEDAVDGRLLAGLKGVAAKDIAAAVTVLIRRGDIPVGARLPTVRTLSEGLSVSAGSISAAWAKLQADGIVSARRRGGTVVIARPGDEERWRTGAFSQPFGPDPMAGRAPAVDLAHGMTDPDFADELLAAFASGLQTPHLNSRYREFITGRLLAVVKSDWPFEAEAWTALGGGGEATILALEAAAPRHSVVAVEQPTSPRILEALARLSLTPVPVPCDAAGPEPDALAAALEMRPSAFIFQPRAQEPLGHHVGGERMRQLAQVLAASPSPTHVVEDDNNGPISVARVHSLGAHVPDRVLHIRAYCKTYGLDMRTSVVGGARVLIERIRSLRSHGYGMTSRILQDALSYLLTSRRAGEMVDEARARYARRREMMAGALRKAGIATTGDDGVLLWVPVPDETRAITNLGMSGISVAAGSQCYISRPESHHIRIGTSRLPDDARYMERLAQRMAHAIKGDAPEVLD